MARLLLMSKIAAEFGVIPLRCLYVWVGISLTFTPGQLCSPFNNSCPVAVGSVTLWPISIGPELLSYCYYNRLRGNVCLSLSEIVGSDTID